MGARGVWARTRRWAAGPAEGSPGPCIVTTALRQQQSKWNKHSAKITGSGNTVRKAAQDMFEPHWPGVDEGGGLGPAEDHTAVGDRVAPAEGVEVAGVALVGEGTLDVLVGRQVVRGEVSMET